MIGRWIETPSLLAFNARALSNRNPSAHHRITALPAHQANLNPRRKMPHLKGNPKIKAAAQSGGSIID
jgi:hypothetical protein